MSVASSIVRAGEERRIVLPTTLVVEDEPDMLDTFVRLLAQVGHRCVLAQTGREAIRLIEAERLNLVVTDLRLPIVDGLAVARRARRASPPIPVIVTTAYGSAEAKRESQQAGATVYLPKPFSTAEFLDAVRHALATGSPDPQRNGPNPERTVTD